MSDEHLATVTRSSSSETRRDAGTAARLSVVHPRGVEWSCTLDDGPRVIGRTSTAAPGPLDHPTVSRNHFEIRYDPSIGQFVGRDLGSHNGSRVDGHPLGGSAVALGEESILQLGDVTLVLERGLPVPDDDVELAEVPGSSLAIAALRAQLRRAADDPSPVLLFGETGTGKEFAARALHEQRGRGPLLSINCAALSPQIIDSQLFGHVRGAFTGANADAPGLFRAADGGSLFLDEIGELPLELQPKLLRALQEGEVQPVGGTRVVKVDVRVIAATNRDLAGAVDAGQFRRDLYARLSLWELHLPPLRRRRRDLLTWIDRLTGAWFSRREQHDAGLPRFDPEAAEVLLLHRWPNNLREVDRLVHALASSHPPGERIGRSDLPGWLAAAPSPEPARAAAEAKPAIPTRDDFVAAFERLSGSVRGLAKHFGRDRRQIYRWIESYGLRRDDSDD
ncbi:MAG: sigma 54-interacting transcriptional regulator [Deltaproteobacteria bacterium]|nr:sigma 54-interacting transcriptional regulator [Deltaproteobacteria bacterium]MBK8717211.1 sigma 54-interacting transcriptional regulator [Deltaproteobacteria bacterium]MBP7286090.1 sigma 54-interacting transcriptional regulator [Nannocystaceae bacterium]